MVDEELDADLRQLDVRKAVVQYELVKEMRKWLRTDGSKRPKPEATVKKIGELCNLAEHQVKAQRMDKFKANELDAEFSQLRAIAQELHNQSPCLPDLKWPTRGTAHPTQNCHGDCQAADVKG
jgi:hypothetical protein